MRAICGTTCVASKDEGKTVFIDYNAWHGTAWHVTELIAEIRDVTR